MSKSHTSDAPSRATDLRLVPGLGVVDLAKPGLPASLAGKLEGELEVFAERMHEGLMSAALAVGLEVFNELLDANVTELAGPKGRHNPDRTAVRHGVDAAVIPQGRVAVIPQGSGVLFSRWRLLPVCCASVVVGVGSCGRRGGGSGRC